LAIALNKESTPEGLKFIMDYTIYQATKLAGEKVNIL